MIIDQKVRLKKLQKKGGLSWSHMAVILTIHEIAKQSLAILNVSEYILHNVLHGYTYVVSINYQGLGSFDVSSQKVEKYL